MEDSIFTRIIKGEIPCHKLYEDDRTIAILDINPVREGHTLVIPKTQIDQYIDLSEDDYVALWLSVKKVADRLRAVTGKDRVGVVIKGIDVPHAHVHLIPFNNDEQLNIEGHEAIGPDHQALAEFADKAKLT